MKRAKRVWRALADFVLVSLAALAFAAMWVIGEVPR